MIIKSIELENIRSYTKQSVEFNSGINFLSGDIGSGKSTILLAIEFALLGFKRGDLEGYQLLRKGEREGSVKLCLIDSSNNEIEIYRKVKKGKSNDNISQENGYIKIDNNLIELSPQEINAKVFEILGFPLEFINKDKNLIYRFTIYTAQEQLKEILFSENEKKLEVIRKLFNIDKYKQLSDAISIYLSNMKTDKKVIESKLEGSSDVSKEIEILDKELKEIELEFKKYKEKEVPFKEKIGKCKLAISKREDFLKQSNEKVLLIEKNLTTIFEIEKNNSELEKKLIQKEKLQTEFSKNDIKLNKDKVEKELKKKTSELEKLRIKLKEFEKINELKTKFENEKELNNSQERNLIEKKNLLKSKSESFDYILTKCQLKDAQVLQNKLLSEIKKYDKLKLKYEDICEEIIKLKSNNENLENNLKEKQKFEIDISKLETCPTCLQDVDCDHKSKITKKYKEDIGKYELEIKSNYKEIKLNEIEKDIMKKELSKFEKIERETLEVGEKIKLLMDKERKEKPLYDELKSLKIEISKLESKKLNENIEKINKDIEKINSQLKEQEKLILIEKNLVNEISDMKIELLKIDNQIKESSFVKEEISEIEKQIKDNNIKIEKRNILEEKLNFLKTKEVEINLDKKKYSDMLDSMYEKDKLLSSKLSSLEAQIDNKKKSLNEKNKLKDEMKKIEEEFKLMIYKEQFLSDKVIKISNLIERAIFTKYYVEFNEEFERLFRDLIEDNEIEVRLDEDFSILIEQNGYDIDIKNLSGGEKSSLAIAYRLGLKKIIENNLKERQKLSLLILDEPTDGFSNEQIDRLGNILKESDLKQIILVSHDEKIESIADSVLKINKINHTSEVS